MQILYKSARITAGALNVLIVFCGIVLILSMIPPACYAPSQNNPSPPGGYLSISSFCRDWKARLPALTGNGSARSRLSTSNPSAPGRIRSRRMMCGFLSLLLAVIAINRFNDRKSFFLHFCEMRSRKTVVLHKSTRKSEGFTLSHSFLWRFPVPPLPALSPWRAAAPTLSSTSCGSNSAFTKYFRFER